MANLQIFISSNLPFFASGANPGMYFHNALRHLFVYFLTIAPIHTKQDLHVVAVLWSHV